MMIEVDSVDSINLDDSVFRYKDFNKLPKPDEEGFQHSLKVKAHILKKIREAGGTRSGGSGGSKGSISFADYMQEALYAPGLGYYMCGKTKFGKEGDFITAPELGPIFAECLARQCQEIFHEIDAVAGVTAKKAIIEVGAGSGQLACDLMSALKKLDSIPDYYYILELSPELKLLQKQKIQKSHPDLYSKFIWLDSVEGIKIQGIIIANEVLDAIPVRRFAIQKSDNRGSVEKQDNLYEAFECRVRENESEFCWDLQKFESFDQDHLNEYKCDYISEFSDLIKPWIKTMSNILDKGAMLIIDYGFPASEYYHIDRSMGTLRCHYRHHVHDNPFFLPGLQDITAHVNFSEVALAAEEAGLSVLGYTTQAHFLLGCDLIDVVNDFQRSGLGSCDQDVPNFQLNHSVQILTSPAEMGELFKVMMMGKGISSEREYKGFCFRNAKEKLFHFGF